MEILYLLCGHFECVKKPVAGFAEHHVASFLWYFAGCRDEHDYWKL